MRSVGMDLGKKQTDICIVDENDKVVERLQLRTKREAFSKRFGNVPACRIAIESCRDSGWVFDHLTALGHEVTVVDTTRARSIGIGQGRRKTDRRDAEALARGMAHRMLPRAHVLSPQSRQLRDVLHARDQLVRLRGRLVTVLRGQFQGRGFLTPPCATSVFGARLRGSGLPGVDAVDVQAMLSVLDSVNAQIEVLEHQIEALSERYEPFERLCSVPGVKLIVAMTFIAALDEASRFHHAHEVQAYLGLVPSEHSTGGKRRTGRITRCGNTMARRLLVQAANSLMRTRAGKEDPLVIWASELAARRGRKRAVVALARRLCGVLWAIWVDGTFYDPKGLARKSWGGLSRRARQAKRSADNMARASAPSCSAVA